MRKEKAGKRVQMKTIHSSQYIFFISIFLFLHLPSAAAADVFFQKKAYIPHKCVRTLSILSDGTVKDKAKHCSKRSIHIRKRISSADMDSIRKMVDQLQFCNLRSEYTADTDSSSVSDSETSVMAARCGQKLKTVSVYGIDHITGRIAEDLSDIDLREMGALAETLLNHPDRAAALQFDQLDTYVWELLSPGSTSPKLDVNESSGQYSMEACRAPLTDAGRSARFQGTAIYKVRTGKQGEINSFAPIYIPAFFRVMLQLNLFEKCARSWRLHPSAEYTLSFQAGNTGETLGRWLIVISKKGGDSMRIILPDTPDSEKSEK